MKCSKCGIEFEEKDVQESHDVPCYLFEGKDRKEKKQKADKFGRHWLCVKCHDIYEKILPSIMIENLHDEKKRQELISIIKAFSIGYFKKNDTTKITD